MPIRTQWKLMTIILVGWWLALVPCGWAQSASRQEPPMQELSKEEARMLAEANQAFADQDWAKAAQLYKAVLEKNPKIGSAWHHLGYSYHVMGQLDEAIIAHQKATEFQRFRALGLYNLACAYSLKKDKDKAFHYLNLALDAGFQSKQFLDTDTDLDFLRSDERFAQVIKKALRTSVMEASLQLDFWVGRWDVCSSQGVPLGTAIVEKKENGKCLSETWKANGGSSGTTLLYFDPSDKKWQFVCVMDKGEIFRGSGEMQDKQLVIRGDHIRLDGSKGLFKLSLQNQTQDKLRYGIEVSTDAGKSWRMAYDVVYVRKASAS